MTATAVAVVFLFIGGRLGTRQRYEAFIATADLIVSEQNAACRILPRFLAITGLGRSIFILHLFYFHKNQSIFLVDDGAFIFLPDLAGPTAGSGS